MRFATARGSRGSDAPVPERMGIMETAPEQGKVYSLLKLAETGSWAESEVEEVLVTSEGVTVNEVPPCIVCGDYGRHEVGCAVGPEPDGVAEGIYYTSWGYDQTNAEFFQVVRDTGASVVLRRIGSEIHAGRLYPAVGQWATDCHLQGNPGTPERLRDEARGYSEKVCRKPRKAREGSCQPNGLRIDDVRTAHLYEGGGAYDTFAAGLPGH